LPITGQLPIILCVQDDRLKTLLLFDAPGRSSYLCHTWSF